MSRNLKLKYWSSVLGHIWSVLNPLLIVIVMAVAEVFSTMVSRNIEIFRYLCSADNC